MNRKSGVLKLGLAALLSLTAVLSGCGEKEEEAGASAAASVTPTTAASAVADSGIKNPRVAFVYIGPPGDGGYTYQHDQGRLYMEKELGIKAKFVENVPESADAERIITQLAQENDIIFTTSFGYMDYTLNVAKKFPKVKFFHCSGYKVSDNMSTYFGKNYQASYLSGIVAGKTTKNNTIGYIGAFPIPEVIYNINAFALGAQSVNKDAKVHVVWSNTWYDPTTERQAAISLLDKGADVLMAYQDSPATIEAAKERGAFAGGNDSDMSRFAPDNYTTNPVWNWGPYYVKAVKSVIDGTFKSEQFSGDMKDGTVALAPFGNKVPDDVKKLVTDKQKEIIDGTFDVFTGPIVDQAGASKVAEGKKLTLEEVLGMNWFIKGVEGTIPK
ncbi:MAG: rane protein [Paenibacillaceae bacterium]|jgi:basic membrane protein A|nr:rane protein [Paenibacillaceae bacterium]